MEERDSPWAGVDPDTLHRVTDPDQAAILVDPRRVRFLWPFLGRECTVSEAAKDLGVSPNAMLYRVRRMLGIGLLQIVRELPRAGSPVKVYRSSHPGYVVPMDAMRYDDLHHRVASQGRVLADQLTTAYTQVLSRSTGGGERVLARTPTGDLWSTDLPPENNDRGQPVHFSDVTVLLTPEEAAQIRRLLLRATERGLEHNRGEPGRREPYLLVTGILPLPRERRTGQAAR